MISLVGTNLGLHKPKKERIQQSTMNFSIGSCKKKRFSGEIREETLKSSNFDSVSVENFFFSQLIVSEKSGKRLFLEFRLVSVFSQ